MIAGLIITNVYEASNTGETMIVNLYALRNHQACIHIQNQGQPIPIDILPNLTKPFFTTKVTRTRLRLAIVKRIIEAHKGELSIESSAATETIVQCIAISNNINP